MSKCAKSRMVYTFRTSEARAILKDYYIDQSAYREMLNLLNNQHFIDRCALPSDMKFLSDDWWLRDTAVVENIIRNKGLWEIHLVFAHYKNPRQLIKRVIATDTSRKRAELYAWYMRRLAAKDQRGTLQVDIREFTICSS